MDPEIKLTDTASIVAMTAALPDIDNGACPKEYEQVIESPEYEDNESGMPDPAHDD